MKKLAIIAAIALFPIFFAGSSFALETCNKTWEAVEVGCFFGSTLKLEVKGSKSVQMYYQPEESTGGLTYSVCSFHTQGNRKFASSSGDQKIFYFLFDDSVNAGTPGACPDAPTGTAGATWGTGWSAM